MNNVLNPLFTFNRIAWQDARQPAGIPESLSNHLEAALSWLTRAHDQSNRGGVSYGYSVRGGWLAPYRETSGYIVTTLYRAAHFLNRPDLLVRATQIAHWLVSVQNQDGSFSNPKYGSDGIVFDTGQDLFGLIAAWEQTQDPTFLNAAKRAGMWLAQVADPQGIWTRFEHKNTPHVYNTRTAWALLRLHQIDPQAQWLKIARANLDWALSCQQTSGFFENNAFVQGDAPYTHNISYAICGLQESGWILNDERYIAAAKRCSDAALALMQPNGFIAGQIDAAGRPKASYSCLTGQCQLAIVWAKQFNTLPDAPLQKAAQQSLHYVMSHHRIHDEHDGVKGGIAGSYPIWGRYAPMSYPNWAAKFFIDAAMLQLKWSQTA